MMQTVSNSGSQAHAVASFSRPRLEMVGGLSVAGTALGVVIGSVGGGTSAIVGGACGGAMFAGFSIAFTS